MLYENERHEVLTDKKWDEKKARSLVQEIFTKVISTFDPEKYWPTDPNEDADIACNKSIYFGASGNLWALDQISKFLQVGMPLNKEKLINEIYDKYLDSPDTEDVVPSFFWEK